VDLWKLTALDVSTLQVDIKVPGLDDQYEVIDDN